MGYKVNPPSIEELRQLAVQRLGTPEAQHAGGLSKEQANKLLEEVAISKIEIEIQNVYLQDTCARLDVALNESTDLYDFAPVGFVSIDTATKISKLNLAAASLLGSERNTLMGRVFVDFFFPEERSRILALLQRATESGEDQHCDVTLGGGNRPLNYVQLALSPLYTLQGHHMVLTNITTRRLQEEQLRASEQGLRAALENFGDGHWEWDLQADTLRYSPGLARLYDSPAEQRGGILEAWRRRLHPDDWPALRDKVQSCLYGQEPRFMSEHRCAGQDRSSHDNWIWMASRASVVGCDAEGRATRLMGVDTDISAAKRTEEELREMRGIKLAMFELLPQYLAVLDADGRVLRTNALWNAYGLASGHPYRNGLASFAYADLLDAVTGGEGAIKRDALAGLAEVLAGKVPSFQLDYSFAAGADRRWFIMRVMAVHGVHARAVVSHQDVTHIRGQGARPAEL